MEIHLVKGDIGKVEVEGLVCPVDGVNCNLGGPAAATAMKASFDPEERDELFGYLEKDVLRLRIVPDGDARIIQGEGLWEWLVIVAALPHSRSDRPISKEEYYSTLKRSIVNAIRTSVNQGIRSISMTPIGTSYRLSEDDSILAMSEALRECQREKIVVHWCFLDEKLKIMAKEHLKSLVVFD